MEYFQMGFAQDFFLFYSDMGLKSRVDFKKAVVLGFCILVTNNFCQEKSLGYVCKKQPVPFFRL